MRRDYARYALGLYGGVEIGVTVFLPLADLIFAEPVFRQDRVTRGGGKIDGLFFVPEHLKYPPYAALYAPRSFKSFV